MIFDALEEWFREEDFYGCLFVTALGMYPEEDTTIRHFCQEAKRLTQNYITRLAEKAELQDADELSEQFMLLIEGATNMTQVNNSHLSAITAFEDIGGVDNLVEWARCNQTEFYRMLARLMPREIHADVNAGTSLVECLRKMEERRAKE